MGLDPLSPVAPARVRVLLLPIGRIKHSRFVTFVKRLQQENVVRLGDISPDPRPNRNMFSPLAFPTGMIVYDLTTALPPPAHLSLSPFEAFREPLAIIGIADGTELGSSASSPDASRARDKDMRHLYQQLEIARDQFPRVLVHRLFLFDYEPAKDAPPLLEDFVGVPPVEQSRTTTMKTVMCDFSSVVLAEMTTLAKSLQGRSTIESPGQRMGGPNWGGYPDSFHRRGSQASLPGDAPGKLDRSMSRMSMPVQLRSAAASLSRNNSFGRTPTPNGRATPTSGNESPEPRSPEQTSTREASRDRMSIQGFGSGSTSERSRNMGKGRVGVTIGTLYMCAGRWVDAIKELTDSATTAKNNIDHLWHAKALENILVSLLMLAWCGHDFQIPPICYASADKSHTPSGDPKAPASNRLVSLQNLVVLLPELLERILNLYSRAANFSGEALPQFPLSQTIIRFAKLQAAIHLSSGNLDDGVLQNLVTGVPLPPTKLGSTRLTISPARTDIVNLLFRAFPPLGQENLTVTDRAIILGGIASVLSALGYKRKKAMVMRELIAILIPGLVQARKVGAAEVGVHPAAGLAALTSIGNANGSSAFELTEGDIESGIDVFLRLLSRIYGVTSFETTSEETDDSDGAIIARIMHNAKTRPFGTLSLKISILQACINLSEALPDFHGVLRFSSDLLRTVGSGIAPGPKSEDASPSIPREEQVRILTNISRTVSAGRQLGITNLCAEYWDEFLVRGVELDLGISLRTPLPHDKHDLQSAAAEPTEKNPFIYNPFLKKVDTADKRLLVADEQAIFRVTLQNPYEFDLELESIKLEAEGVDFESSVQSTVIGPYRTQILSVHGTPKSAGTLSITGCVIRVRGCRERRFPIFHEPWTWNLEHKFKATGLASIESTDVVDVQRRQASINAPKTSKFSVQVIDAQPVVVVKSTTISQSAVMVLQGQRQVFSLTLENQSPTIAVDLLLFSFQDSTQSPIQAAMKNKDATPFDLYEYEVILTQKQALRWLPKDDAPPYIAPGSTATFDFEILGRPGLTSATIQIDYAHLGKPQAEVQGRFHTRQVSLPLTTTVNASMELVRMDILPLASNDFSPLSPHEMKQESAAEITGDDYCLVILDFRNSWPNVLDVCLDIGQGRSITEMLAPADTKRILFPFKRIHIPNPFAAIPSLDPSRQRQFVVSASKVSAETERHNREMFWYREEMLKTLRATWTARMGWAGDIDLRGMRLNSRMVDTIKLDEVEIELSVDGVTPTIGSSARYHVPVNSFLKVCVRMTNRSTEPILPLLRLQPFILHQPHHAALELAKKFACDGVSQRALPPLSAGQTTDFSVVMTPLCRGEFEVDALVEETKVWSPSVVEPAQPDAAALPDILAGVRERRLWYARRRFVLVVEDDD